MTKRLLICLFGLFLSTAGLNAQTLIKSIPIAPAKFFTTDELGNIYIVFSDNSVTKFDSNGDSLFTFRSVLNGDIETVDATNPLKPLLFYPSYSKVVVLDRQLTLKNEFDLKRHNLFNINAIAAATNGGLWVYDQQNATLKRFDELFVLQHKSNDLRSETSELPQPFMALENDRKTYLIDSTKGIYVFDQFGSFLNIIELFHVKHFQAFGPILVYRVNDSLVSFDQTTSQFNYIALPTDEDFVAARIEKGKLFYLFRNRFQIYNL